MLLAVFLSAGDVHADMRSAEAAFQNQDYPAAFAEWKRLADDGNAVAAFNVAQMYKRGLGIAENEDLAEQYMRQAAEAGNPAAQGRLGTFLFFKSSQGDVEEALKWWRDGARAGDAHAQYSYGVILANGDYVEQDLPAAFYWLSLAAAADDEEARRARDLVARKLSPAQVAAVAKRLEEADVPVAPVKHVDVPSASASPPPPEEPDPSSQQAAATAEPAASPAETEPRPDSAAQPAENPAPINGYYTVQLAALAERSQADRFWREISERHPVLLDDQPVEFARANLGAERGIVYRVRVGSFANAAEAASFCSELKAAGASCFVARRNPTE